MVSSVKFRNFKGFQNFELNNMTPIVLLSGRNNTGKTSILEGMFLYVDHKSPESFIKLNNFRGIVQPVTSSKIWESLFYQMNVDDVMDISFVEDGVESILSYTADRSFIPNDALIHSDVLNQFISAAKANYSLKYTFKLNEYEETGHYSVNETGIYGNSLTNNNASPMEMKHCQFINNIISTNDIAVVDWFGKVELEGKKDAVINSLKIIERDIEDVRVISIGGQPNLYASIQGKLLPLKLCGDGINRLLYLILSIMENKNSLIFIDEIETGYHYSIYPQIWELLAYIAETNNCQVIATTHSIECISGAIMGIEHACRENLFSYYRLDRNAEPIAHRFSFEMLKYAMDADMEVR